MSALLIAPNNLSLRVAKNPLEIVFLAYLSPNLLYRKRLLTE
jgi:hypothetical protein